jgi:polyisoprenoid-binding protein YceI
MMRRALVVGGVVGLISAAGFLGGMSAPAPSVEVAPSVAAGSFSVDPVHSSVVFRIKHLNTSYFYGHFNDLSGTIAFDDAKPEASSMDLTVKIDSVDTHNSGRNDHLKSVTFFNAAEIPTATFKSTAWKSSGENAFDVTGDLTLHGVKKAITVKVEKTGSGKGQKGEDLVGFETTFTVKRSDYGMTQMVGPIGDEVKLMIGIEAKAGGK